MNIVNAFPTVVKAFPAMDTSFRNALFGNAQKQKRPAKCVRVHADVSLLPLSLQKNPKNKPKPPLRHNFTSRKPQFNSLSPLLTTFTANNETKLSMPTS